MWGQTRSHCQISPLILLLVRLNGLPCFLLFGWVRPLHRRVSLSLCQSRVSLLLRYIALSSHVFLMIDHNSSALNWLSLSAVFDGLMCYCGLMVLYRSLLVVRFEGLQMLCWSLRRSCSVSIVVRRNCDARLDVDWDVLSVEGRFQHVWVCDHALRKLMESSHITQLHFHLS